MQQKHRSRKNFSAASSLNPWLEAALRAAENGQLDKLITYCIKRVKTHPKDERAWFEGMRALILDGKLQEARSFGQQAIKHVPKSYGVHVNLTHLFIKLGDYKEAVIAAEKSTDINPGDYYGWLNRSSAHYYMKQPTEAEYAAKQAIAIDPKVDSAWCNLGNALKDHGKIKEALEAYKHGLEISPTPAMFIDNILLTLVYDETTTTQDIVYWSKRYEALINDTINAKHNDRKHHQQQRRKRIAFISPDICNHPVMYFLEPLLANLDRSRFEVWILATRSIRDMITLRAIRLADHFELVADRDPEQLAQQIRDWDIDIIIDPAGHTEKNALKVLARKAAPLQINWLGFPATTGLSAIDWRLTDAVADMEPQTLAARGLDAEQEPPLGEQYSEKLAFLPDAFCVYRPCIRHALQRYHWDYLPRPTPALRNGYITFGCCNNLAKISNRALLLWGRILAAVPRSRLLLEGAGLGNPIHSQAFKERLAGLDLPVDRFDLIERDPARQYITYHDIDIALDPFPLTGGTTTFDVLWFGVPLVSLEGCNFRSRISATLLANAGLSSWLARTEDAYLAIAVDLARDPEALNAIRLDLRYRVEASPLCDEERFCTAVATALETMWDQVMQGNVPEYLHIPAPTPDDRTGKTVAVTSGKRIPLAQAHSDLAAALAKARNIIPPTPPTEIHPDWQTVLGQALQILETIPNDVEALLALATMEIVHTNWPVTRGYLRTAYEHLPEGPRRSQVFTQLCDMLAKMGDGQTLVALCERRLRTVPGDAAAWHFLGKGYVHIGQFAKAVEALQRSRTLAPAVVENTVLLIVAYDRLRRFAEAYATSRDRVATFPNDPVVWTDHAQCCVKVERYAEGEKAARQALQLREIDAAWNGLGQNLLHQGRVDEAVDALTRATTLAPGQPVFQTNLHLARLASPRVPVAQTAAAARAWGASCTTEPATPASQDPLDPHKRLRLGLLLSDLHEPGLMDVLEPVLTRLDRTAVEVCLFCPEVAGAADTLPARVKRLADAWHALPNMVTPTALTALLAGQALDMLLDTGGHAARASLTALAVRPAPVQAGWLGTAGTSGLVAMDWRITDTVTDREPGELLAAGLPAARLEGAAPLAEQYTEQLARLPDASCVYRPHTNAPLMRYFPALQVQNTPALRQGAITFGSCAPLYRLNDTVLGLWARVLAAVPGSRLLIEGDGWQEAEAAGLFLQRLTRAGLDAQRVLLVPRNPDKQYLTYHHIDIVLDTFPLTEAVTTLEALWMGVPVVTLEGASSRGRASTSLLTVLGNPDWIARSEDDYVALAARLAGDIPSLNVTRMNLRPRLQNAPLMNEERFARHFERLLRELWWRHCAAVQAPGDPGAQADILNGYRANQPAVAAVRQWVFLDPDRRLELEEARAALQKLLTSAAAQPSQPDNVSAAWRETIALAAAILGSVPREPVALATLAESEWAHGNAAQAMAYMGQAWDAAPLAVPLARRLAAWAASSGNTAMVEAIRRVAASRGITLEENNAS